MIGPFRYFDFGSFFFLIIRAELPLINNSRWSLYKYFILDLTIQHLQISPFKLYLYLKPLYSILGGSTILAEPFTKKPIYVIFLLKPLYKWKILTHRILVLSIICNHDSFCNNYIIIRLCELMRIALMQYRLWAGLRTTWKLV